MKRHEFDSAALIAGLLFAGLAAAYLLDAAGVWHVSWRLTASVTAGGLAGAWAAAAAGRSRRRRRPPPGSRPSREAGPH